MADEMQLKQHLAQHNIREQVGDVLACYEIDHNFYGEGTVTPMSIDFYSLTLIIEGEAVVFANYDEYRLHCGDVLLLSPNTVSALTSTSKDCRCITLNYDVFAFQNVLLAQPRFQKHRLFFQHFGVITTHIDSPDFEALHQTLLAVRRYTLISSDQQAEILKHLVEVVMLDLLRHLPEQLLSLRKKSRAEQMLHQLFDLMLQHYRTEHTIDFYASRLCITPIYLSRIVRQQLRHTVNYYLSGLLYAEACQLLRFTDLPVSEIACLLNYSDQSAFGKFFKQKSGLSPMAYRMKR